MPPDELEDLAAQIAQFGLLEARNLDWRNEAIPLRFPLFELMNAAGYTRGYDDWIHCLPGTEYRLERLARRRAGAERDMEIALREPVTCRRKDSTRASGDLAPPGW